VRQTARSSDADTANDDDSRRPLRVYLVEDAPSFRERLADFLTETGEVELAGFADSEAAALQDLRGTPPDVVIVDLHLREGSGIGVIASLRSQWPQRPPTIVVLTNYAFPEFESACRARGADHFYDKSTQFAAVKTLLYSLREPNA
jgi:DNA-binding NarL/FixJ family response regulator